MSKLFFAFSIDDSRFFIFSFISLPASDWESYVAARAFMLFSICSAWACSSSPNCWLFKATSSLGAAGVVGAVGLAGTGAGGAGGGA